MEFNSNGFFNTGTYCKYLGNMGLIENIYTAMKNPDLSVVVVTVLRIIQETGTMPHAKSLKKNELVSTALRNNGNSFYIKNDYKTAFTFYNRAICLAPKRSEAAMFAYSNRSALLFKIEAFRACCDDIKTCLAMTPSDDLKKKLKQREKDCNKQKPNEYELIDNYIKFDSAILSFFKISHHSDVHSVSNDVNFVNEKGSFRVEASRNVRVGTVVAVEEAFASYKDSEKQYQLCHHCHKVCLNLMPCDNCCFVMFCSDDCAQVSWKQYHSVECQLSEILNEVSDNPFLQMTIRAFLKIKHDTSWRAVIHASQNIGSGRTAHEIYDSKHTWALLNSATNKQLMHGKMFKASLNLAVIVHHLSEIEGFLPQNSERDAAIAAMARIMMHLYLYSIYIPIICTSKDLSQNVYKGGDSSNYGWFAFTCKLPHSCEPNLCTIGLNNKVALIAIRPIGRGDPLTVTYVPSWYGYKAPNIFKPPMDVRACMLFDIARIICRCRVCLEKWSPDNCTKHTLRDNEKGLYNKVKYVAIKDPILGAYDACTKALTKFTHIPHTDVYLEVYKTFRLSLNYILYAATTNVTF